MEEFYSEELMSTAELLRKEKEKNHRPLKKKQQKRVVKYRLTY